MAIESCDPPDRPCILIVDDDADLMAFLFSVLIDEGFSIVAASHGQQAMDLLERGLRPHLFLIDLMLPRISGFDLLNHIRTDRSLRTIPTIVMTGASERSPIVADVVFQKPFDHNELLAAIRRLIATAKSKSVDPVTSGARAHDQSSRKA
jgi:DNA-binding response OmpR family regulator